MAEDLQSKAGELMKKILTVGVGTFFLTEESLRTLISDFKLPKELLAGVVESAHRTKDEFLKTLSKEMMSQVIERVDPVALVQELLTKNEVELKIRLNLKPRKKSASETHDSSEE